MSTAGSDDKSARFDMASVRQLLAELARLPAAWVGFVGVLAFASVVKLDLGESGVWTCAIEASAVTAGFAALLWLPLLLKAIALTGGGIKTSVAEGNFGGLLDVLKVDSALITAAEMAQEGSPEARDALKQAKQAARRRVEEAGVGKAEARRRLSEIVSRYEDTRRTEEPSGARTLRMATLMQEARLLVPAAEFTPEEIIAMARTPHDPARPDIAGPRMLAVAIMETRPDLAFRDVLLDTIANRRSRFEQYHALLALEAVTALASPTERAEIAQQLEATTKSADLVDGRDTSRKRVVERIVAMSKG
jgi:hypothetical protein